MLLIIDGQSLPIVQANVSYKEDEPIYLNCYFPFDEDGEGEVFNSAEIIKILKSVGPETKMTVKYETQDAEDVFTGYKFVQLTYNNIYTNNNGTSTTFKEVTKLVGVFSKVSIINSVEKAMD